MFVLEHRTEFPCSVDELFSFVVHKELFLRLIPPWSKERVVQSDPQWPAVGTCLKTTKGVWTVCDMQPGQEVTFAFKGQLYKELVRTLSIVPANAVHAELSERLSFSLPPVLAKGEQRALLWRHQTLLADFLVLKRYPSPLKRILVTGASGLIGSALCPFLKVAGFEVLPLKREQYRSGGVALEGFDAIVHLAGRDLAAKRWTKEEKKRLFQSRVQSTEALSSTLLKLKNPPKTCILASAIGYYGDCKEREVTEEAARGEGFLAELVEQWERAAEPLKKGGIRVAHARFAPVLSPKGGVLPKRLVPFKCFLGGSLGDGGQQVSYVAIDDAVYALYFALVTDRLSGPFNVVSPEHRSEREFAYLLGKKLLRPSFFSLPAWLLKRIFGKEKAEELFLKSVAAVPKRLQDEGFVFQYPDLEKILEHLL